MTSFWVLLLFLPYIYGRLINLASLKHYQHVRTNLLTFSHDSHDIEYTFEAYGHNFHLELTRNLELLHPDYAEYIWHDGKLIEKPRGTDPHNHCYYIGYVRDDVASSVAVSLCDGLKGLIQAYGENYIIHPHHLTIGSTNKTVGNAPKGFSFVHYENHVVFPHEAFGYGEHSCGVVHGDSHSSADSFSLSDPFPQPQGRRRLLQVPGQKYVELLAVNDYARIQDKGGFTENITLNIANVASSCYSNSAFNPPISVVLVAQISFTNGDPYPASPYGSSEVQLQPLLDSFLNWATTNWSSLPKHDSHILVSGFDFQGSYVGLAPVGGQTANGPVGMCVDSSSGAVTQAYNYDDALDGATMAHEMGHTLSMQHDTSPPTCPDSGYVMQAVADAGGKPASSFSPCSISAYASWLQIGQVCLNNVPTTRWGDGVCGNGIIETGEQCDCGKDTSCAADPCCNGPVCRLKAGAQYQCSNSQVCCSNCAFVAQSANQPCHYKSNTGCDGDEYCSGASGDCPTTNNAKPGVSCTDNYGAQGDCFQGACHSWTGRCQGINSSYSACSNNEYGGLPACVAQYCTTDPASGVCFPVNGTNPNTTFAEDGVPCGSSKQCLAGQCLDSATLFTELNPANPYNNDPNGLLPDGIDVNKIIMYAAIALGVGLILSILWRCCCNQKRRIVYVQRLRNANQRQQVVVQVEGQPNGVVSQPPAAREGEGVLDVGGGHVLEFGGRGSAILPPGWTAHYTSDGRPYWFNTQRGETSWTFPTA